MIWIIHLFDLIMLWFTVYFTIVSMGKILLKNQYFELMELSD